MKLFSLRVASPDLDRALGGVLCHDVEDPAKHGRTLLPKGRVLSADDLATLRRGDRAEVHVALVEPGDLHEDAAGRRLAEAAAGPGIRLTGPSQSRVNLVAAHHGLLRVDVARLEQVNTIRDVSIFTIFNDQVVTEGQLVAGAKATPLVVAEATIREAEKLLREGPLVSVLPFQPRRVAAVVRDRLDEAARARFRELLGQKIGWFGSALTEVCFVSDEIDEIGAAIARCQEEGADIILTAGGDSADPLDATVQALGRLGASMERHGPPAHPGSTLWLAYLGPVAIFGLASCGIYSRTTVADLVLARVLSGETVDNRSIATLGHGGMLTKDMRFRFPSYSGRRDPENEE